MTTKVDIKKGITLDSWNGSDATDVSTYHTLDNFDDAVALRMLIQKFIKGLGGEKLAKSAETVTFIKSMDTEKRHFTAVVLRPETVDAHGDIYSHDVVVDAQEDYMLKSQQGNVQHMFNTDEMGLVESYIAKSDALDGGILTGDWVMTMKVNDDTLWDLCKAGEFTGFSVGCKGTVEEITPDV